jgi:aspartyl-tRNA(Asn)/glutamyl-tRNA(Gln) amidotransferase subunit A
MVKSLEQVKKENKEINAILEFNKEQKNSKKGLLSGKVIGIKANINCLGLHASCASKVLEDYFSTYDATVIKKIKEEGGIILGTCNMDEFASGSSGETSSFGPTKNPKNPKLITGGSSSGSAAAVAADFVDISLGSDTGGSIRNPASHCGVVGIKPTYGTVSRYGLIDLSMSLDQIGPIAKNVMDASKMLKVIQGKDERDSISIDSPEIDLEKIEKIPKNLKIGVLDYDIGNKEIQDSINSKIRYAAEKYGWEIRKIKIKDIDVAIETYYPIVYVEFFSGTRKLDGRRYGKRIEEAAGPEVLRRVLGGSEITKAEYGGRYYDKALKVKKALEKEFQKAFSEVDAIVSPVVPRLPHKIGEEISVKDMYSYDVLTTPYNLYGNCAMSLPCSEINGIPFGMQIACDRLQDEKMLQIARSIEKLD